MERSSEAQTKAPSNRFTTNLPSQQRLLAHTNPGRLFRPLLLLRLPLLLLLPQRTREPKHLTQPLPLQDLLLPQHLQELFRLHQLHTKTILPLHIRHNIRRDLPPHPGDILHTHFRTLDREHLPSWQLHTDGTSKLHYLFSIQWYSRYKAVVSKEI